MTIDDWDAPLNADKQHFLWTTSNVKVSHEVISIIQVRRSWTVFPSKLLELPKLKNGASENIYIAIQEYFVHW